MANEKKAIWVKNAKGTVHTVTPEHFEAMKIVNQLVKIDEPKKAK